MLAENDVFARAEQEESTSTIGALRFALRQALVADQRALLVTDETADRDTLQRSLADFSVDLRGRDDLGKNRLAELKEFEKTRLPLQRLHVHEEGSRGVRDLSNVKAALRSAGQVLFDM